MSVIGYNIFGVETTQVEAGPNIINKIMGGGAYEGQKRYSVRYSSPKGTLTGRQEASLSAAVKEAKSGTRSNSKTYRIDSHWEEDDISKYYNDESNVGPRPKAEEKEESENPQAGDAGLPESTQSETETNPMLVYGIVGLGALGLLAFLRR
jgi:hypothetical protein